jgi:microcystin degradation protein MlrC
MKVLIARMNHETNTFSPVPTPLSSFGNDGPTYGAEAYTENKGKRTAMSAFIDLAEARGAELVTPVSATAYPSGRVDAQAYQEICDRIVAEAPGCDAILLDLHGAMAVESTDDGEGDLLERVRAAAPGAPIAVALDLHANGTQKMIDHANVIISFKTYPHIDMYETGDHAGRLLFDSMDGKCKPVLAWRSLPLVSHTLRSNTAEGAMRDAVQAARDAEAAGALGVSILAGFGLADIPRPCLSVVVVGDGDAAEADVWRPKSPARSGPSAKDSCTTASRWRNRWRGPRHWRKRPTDLSYCWTMATTA